MFWVCVAPAEHSTERIHAVVLFDEPVTNASFSAQMLGRMRIGFQFLTQMRHLHTEIVRVFLGIVPP
jgi:hypothetical protein